MTLRKQSWVVLIALAFVQIFMFGPSVGTIGVFIPPLIKEYGWDHAQVSRIATAYDLALGSFSFLAGYFLDRINARWIISGGALLAGLGCLAAATTHSLTALFVCYLVIGAGVALSGTVSSIVVAVNWFPGQRALAVSITILGVGIGMALAPRLVTDIVIASSWRWGITAIGLPMIVLAFPVSLVFIRSRPKEKLAAGEEDVGLAGLEVGEAVRTAPFWLLMSAAFLSEITIGEVFFHVIPYLIGVGYTPRSAATYFGIQALIIGPVALAMGAAADRFGSKRVLALVLLSLSGSVGALLLASIHWMGIAPIIGWIMLWTIGMYSSSLIPVLMSQTLGMRRFGTLAGIEHVSAYVGQSIGPVLAGALFDMSGNYALAFQLAILVGLLSVCSIFFIYPAKGHDRLPEVVRAAAI